MEVRHCNGRLEISLDKKVKDLAVILKSKNSEYIYLPNCGKPERCCYGYTQGKNFVYKSISGKSSEFFLGFDGDMDKIGKLELVFRENKSPRNISINL